MNFTQRPHSPVLRRKRTIGSMLLGSAVVLGAVTLAVAEAPPAAPSRLTAAEVDRRGLSLGLDWRSVFGESIVTAALPIPAGPADPRRLLDTTADGSLVAVADRIGPLATELVLARANGDQLRVPMGGLLGATFAADGSWLAVIDGAGSLQRVSTADGEALSLADGPFIGHPVVTREGDLLLLAVPSVEAPYRSSLVRVDANGEMSGPLTDDELIYAATLLDDGSVAVVAHVPNGSTIRRMTDGSVTDLAKLEPGAIHVAVSGDGGQIAWEVAADGVYLQTQHRTVERLGQGSWPRFAPDGRAILVDRDSGPALIDLATRRVEALSAQAAAFLACAGCRS